MKPEFSDSELKRPGASWSHRWQDPSAVRVKIEPCYIRTEQPAPPPAASVPLASHRQPAGIVNRRQLPVPNEGSVDVDPRPHKCSLCDRSFSESWRLRGHMRSHNNERPFKCTYCPRAFFKKNVFTAHVRCHTSDKPYVCDLCHIAFMSESTYVKHMEQHSWASFTSDWPRARGDCQSYLYNCYSAPTCDWGLLHDVFARSSSGSEPQK